VGVEICPKDKRELHTCELDALCCFLAWRRLTGERENLKAASSSSTVTKENILG
jgi:hypothetical protein